jgi:hypothetical protein
MRFDGDRRRMLVLALDDRTEAEGAERAVAQSDEVALAMAFASGANADEVLERHGFTPLGAVPVLARPLRLSAALRAVGIARAIPELPLLMPFGRSRRSGVREIAAKKEPRATRLWDRFSIDVVAAVERTAAFLDRAVFEHLGDEHAPAGHRVFVFEDGDRYVIRAMCIFRVAVESGVVRGYVTELLHDRSLAGMRAASHLLGLALREMSDAGAEVAIAWSLQHSGSYPIYARHGFLMRPRDEALRFGIRTFDPRLDAVTNRESWYLSLLDAPSGW